MPKPERTVDLILAFAWTCLDCKKENFARGITIENPEMIAEAQEQLGGQGELQLAPTRVRCSKCGARFAVGEEP